MKLILHSFFSCLPAASASAAAASSTPSSFPPSAPISVVTTVDSVIHIEGDKSSTGNSDDDWWSFESVHFIGQKSSIEHGSDVLISAKC
ncbi:unnamed protein product [Callosobruchus maculatus]|uniref:Uncharacterized protein n=1 Tax=Callosobruchus maculatus TaxID=64391 RepID=A0A653DQ24_CALMS|nr:unnamed protein product [Callosobruchus maculatus]